MDNDDIDRHPDLRGLRESRGFGVRARWQARRNRARLVRQWRSPDIGRPQRRRTAALIAGIIVAAIGAVAVATYWNDLTGQSSAEEPATRTPPSTTSTKYVPNAAVDLSQPFVGTPAAGWRNGIAGIRNPGTRAIGEHSAAQVAAAVKAVRRTVAAAYLNRKVIVRHEISRVLATLAPEARWQAEQDPNLAHAGIVQIDPDRRLLPASPKMKGQLTVRAGKPGELKVRARFAVAYAFDTDQPERLSAALDIVSIVNADLNFSVYSGSEWSAASHGVYLLQEQLHMFSIDCDALKRGYLAPSGPARSFDSAQPEHGAEHYFDPTKPLGTESNCPEK